MYRRHKDTMGIKAIVSGRFPGFPFSRSFSLICVAAVWFSALLLAAAGCGKKAMPSPPASEAIPAVTDLSHDIQGGMVFLAWSVPEKILKGDFGKGEMILSRAGTRLTDELCEDCPPVYQRIAEFPIPEWKASGRQTHSEQIVRGFRYIYRIELHMDGGQRSGASNLVTFDY